MTTYLTNTQDNLIPMFRKTKLGLAFLKHVLFPIFQTSTLKHSSNAGIVVSNPGMELNESYIPKRKSTASQAWRSKSFYFFANIFTEQERVKTNANKLNSMNNYEP